MAGPPRGGRRILRHAAENVGVGSIERHRFWQVRMPFDRAVAFVRTHPPHGGRLVLSESVGSHGGAKKNRELAWRFRPTHLIAIRSLGVTLLRLSAQVTGIRADGQDAWSVRPPNEKIPRGVREITIYRTASRVYRSRPLFVRVRGASVARIVRILDALPVLKPGAAPLCPAVPGPVLISDFREAGGHLLAQARIDSSGFATICNPVQFSIGGHVQTPLVGNFTQQVQRLLHRRLIVFRY
ncbi:MAG TPA: hypothetical protein VJ716_07045 [Gaiellaceae bacterium]|nr:hypothetical protein [Gaiellaceae bacterium]